MAGIAEARAWLAQAGRVAALAGAGVSAENDIPTFRGAGGLWQNYKLWFGEPLPEGIIYDAEQAVSSAEVFLVIGTSAVVYPAARLVPFARQSGAKVIEINTEATALTSAVDCVLQGKAGELLPQLL